MEPISFTVGIVGLAGLFSVCLDVIDKVDSYKDYGVESRSILAQFDADKHLCRSGIHTLVTSMVGWCLDLSYINGRNFASRNNG